MNTTDKRFQAAMTAMNGMLLWQPNLNTRQLIEWSVELADALLAELDRTELDWTKPREDKKP